MIITIGILLACVGLATWVGRRAWGRAEEGDVVWASALAPELPSAPVKVLSTAPAAVRHVGASLTTTVADYAAALPSSDMQTFEQQVVGNDDWSAFEQAFIDYENAMLERREWSRGVLGVDEESTQQRIDRWLSEGGDGVRHHRADARAAASDTWNAPSRELPMLDSYVADRMAEAMLQA